MNNVFKRKLTTTLATLLVPLAAACGTEATSTPEGPVTFGDETETELKQLSYLASGGAMQAAGFTVFALDLISEQVDCVTKTDSGAVVTFEADNCRFDDTTYSGTATLTNVFGAVSSSDYDPTVASVFVFDNLSIAEPEQTLVYDGVIELGARDDDSRTTVTDFTLTGTDGIAVTERSTTVCAVPATSCTIDRSSTATIDSLGTFNLEGTRGQVNGELSGVLTFRGANTMVVDLGAVQGCALFTADGGSPRQVCDGQ